MSLMSLVLALVPTVVAARVKPDLPDVEITKLKKELAEAKAEIERVIERNEQLIIERDSARKSRVLDGMVYRQQVQNAQAQAAMCQQAQLAAVQQNAYSYNQQMAQHHQMQAMQQAQYAFANPFNHIVDCTGGGRARHLLGSLRLG